MGDDSGIWVGETTRPDTYRLVRLLGGGAEGEVWEAELPLSKDGRRRVAVKILPGGDPLPDDEWNAHRDLLKSLAAPGLVRVVDVFLGPVKHRAGTVEAGDAAALDPDRARHYVVMDYVEGVPLNRWIEENDGVGVTARLAMLGTAASGLDELHAGVATGISAVHGDVKPSNLVVDDRGTAVLVDLGLAQLMDGRRRDGLTPSYAAPELVDSTSLPTPASDRFAFAATVVQLLTGMLPASRDGHVDRDAVAEQLRSTPSLEGRDDLIAAVLGALDPDPQQRPTALRPWLSGLTQAVSSITRPSMADRAAAAEPEQPEQQPEPEPEREDAAETTERPPPASAPEPVTVLRDRPSPAPGVHVVPGTPVQPPATDAAHDARRRTQGVFWGVGAVAVVAALITATLVSMHDPSSVTVAPVAAPAGTSTSSTAPSGGAASTAASTATSTAAAAPDVGALPPRRPYGFGGEPAPPPQPAPAAAPAPAPTTVVTTSTAPGSAQFEVAPASLALGPSTSQGSFQVVNTGTAAATFSVAAKGQGFSATPPSGALGIGQSATITVTLDRTQLSEGDVSGTVTVAGGSTSATVPVTAREERRPDIKTWRAAGTLYTGASCGPVQSYVTISAADDSPLSATLYANGGSQRMSLSGSDFVGLLGPYPTAGQYSYSMVVTDSRGNTSSKTFTVTVQPCA